MASEVGLERGAPLWGVSAEFDSPQALTAATWALRAAGVGRVDCFTPVPVPEVSEALDVRPQTTAVRAAATAGAALGFIAMMGMCIYATAYDYRFNIGGRPQVSWPAFMVPSVSFATLAGAVASLLLMMFLNRLPRLNHPAFNIPGFSRATQDRFFLAVEAREDGFDPAEVEGHLARLPRAPLAVHRVPR